MIPKKIQIKNFLSYGQEIQTIDFDPYHLVCLSGKNGHGKSALLDAITWAIWGQARKVTGATKADQGLLRLGQTHMLVILDFVCKDTTYRVRREFALTYGKPHTALDFGIIDETNNTVIPLTDKTIRITQKKIIQTIHLDYESFINSAFLRQGHANEFSKKAPKDRKEILANILGLQRYETLRKLANDRAREQLAQTNVLCANQEKIESELAQEDTIQAAKLQIKKQLDGLKQQETSLATEQKLIQQQREQLQKQRHQKEQLEKEQQQLTKTEKTMQSNVRTIFTTWRSVNKQQYSMKPIQEIKKEKELCEQNIITWQQALQKKLEKKEQYLKAKEAIAQIEQALHKKQLDAVHKQKLHEQQLILEHKQIKQNIDTLSKQITSCQAEHEQLEADIKQLKKCLIQHDQNSSLQEQQFEKRRAHYQQWIAQANWLKNELLSIKTKNEELTHVDSPSCPLCEQNLTASRKKFLRLKFAKNASFLAHRYNRLSRHIKRLKQLLIDQHAHITTLKKQEEQAKLKTAKLQETQKKATALQHQITELNKQHKIEEKGIKKLEQQISKQQELIKTLKKEAQKNNKKDATYKKKIKQLSTIKKAFEEIIYDQKQHQKEQERCKKLQTQLTDYEQIQQEIALQGERKKQVSHLCIQLKQIKKELTLKSKQHKQYAQLDQQEKSCIQKESDLHKKIKTLIKEKETILQEKGRLEQQQATLEKLKKEHKQQEKEIKQLKQECDDYQTLVTALGKNGIQALLIEDAIPEIEQEANQLLSRLTENQAQILIESLRDLKSGGTKETLDINISDAVGIRPYELFSGGEAFRIDFALRIAISKLLARRAGTSLQTLIIDEGFGSQDEEGLSYIMDAIYKIQDDFKKVIIVSHLPRLKDQFPVHFYVQKNPQGSHIQVIEQA